MSPLGAGGMGEVYRARDTKLNRIVALKVLPEVFARDAERMARFQREAQLLASLNHSGIAAIYGLEESLNGSTRSSALVMELADGPTLADLIAKGALPVDEALAIAKQIAEALEYAHDRGIIHRDLKPANVKISDSGQVKLLDFGLAKALEPSGTGDGGSGVGLTQSPTITAMATQAGIILGTAGYMSPEQARGKPVDKRGDIWSFGVVLFEMLTGLPPFEGETVTDTLAAVVRADPDWQALPPAMPTSVRRLLRRCLEKDPKRRLRDIGEVRIECDEIEAGDEAPQTADARVGRPRYIVTAVLCLAAMAVGAGLAWWLKAPGPAPRVMRITETLPGDQRPTGRRHHWMALSPDGTRLVYGANQRLYLRSLSTLAAVEVPGTEGALNPFFSPDGQWIGYWTAGSLKKTSVQGGDQVFLCPTEYSSAYWGTDGWILFNTPYGGLLRVTAAGGKPEILTTPTANVSCSHPQMLPDGKTVLYLRDQGSVGEIVQRSLASGEEAVILSGVGDFRYVRTGHLVYASGPNLMAVAYDPASRKVAGNPVTVIENVERTVSDGSRQFTVSENGTLAYLAAQGSDADARLVAVDRSGQAVPLPAEARDYSDPRVSPDGRSIAVHDQGTMDDVWVADSERGTLTRLSFGAGEDETPAWSPDGRFVAWAASTSDMIRGILMRPGDGSGKEELLWKLDKHAHLREWLPDGRSLLLEIFDPKSHTDIWRLELGNPPVATPILQTPFNERNSRVSADGRWIAYVSDESGRDEVYIQSFPLGGAKLQVTSGGGDQPVWSRNGRALFFRAAGSIQEVSFEAGTRPRIGRAHALFPDRFENPQAGNHTGYDVFPDGRFLMIQQPQSQQESGVPQIRIVFVFNWFEELKRLVADAGEVKP